MFFPVTTDNVLFIKHFGFYWPFNLTTSKIGNVRKDRKIHVLLLSFQSSNRVSKVLPEEQCH